VTEYGNNKSFKMTTLTIDGRVVETEEKDMPLLWFLRDKLQKTGTRFGCGKGLCGACTVLVDNHAVRSCQLPVLALDGKKVTTIEGLSENGDHPLQKAWQEKNVPQCGYCQGGQILSAVSLLNSHPNPSDEDIDDAMVGNICRCGTYGRIREAIKSVQGGSQ
jgi:isoquinoline 1-oxidoreductase alpha subunit